MLGRVHLRRVGVLNQIVALQDIKHLFWDDASRSTDVVHRQADVLVLWHAQQIPVYRQGPVCAISDKPEIRQWLLWRAQSLLLLAQQVAEVDEQIAPPSTLTDW